MTREVVNEKIRQFVLGHFPSARAKDLKDNDLLLERGIVDSLGVLDLVAFLEHEFAISVTDEELVPESFASIAKLASFVLGKRQGRCVQ